MNPSGSSKLPPALNELDRALITIFLNELTIQTQALQKSLESLHANPKDKAALEALFKVFQAIVQAGKIVRLDAIVEFVKVFASLIEEMEEGKGVWDLEREKAAYQFLNFLKDLSHISPDQLDSFMKMQRDFLKELLMRVRKLYQSKEIPTLTEKPPTLSEDAMADQTMYELFKNELETQTNALSQGLIELENEPNEKGLLENLMRAAHSIKGAARVIALSPIVQLAHTMEDCFVAAQKGKLEIKGDEVDLLLKGVDLLTRLSNVQFEELNGWLSEQHSAIEPLITDIQASMNIPSARIEKKPPVSVPLTIAKQLIEREEPKTIETMKPFKTSFARDRVLRITAENLNRLMGLAGESLVESRWLHPFGDSLQSLKLKFKNLGNTLDLLREHIKTVEMSERGQHFLIDLHDQINEVYDQMNERLGELESFIGRHASLSDRLYQEVINSRMRPFADGVEAFPRMVRDLARQLGKEVRLEIEGRSTPVDRDILEKLESPLGHLLRNAVDHGIETPEERVANGKPPVGLIKMEAGHRGGMLSITVADDGRGLDLVKLRNAIVEKKLVNLDLAKRLTSSEIIDFLYLPGFSTSANVSEISGRGVGLNIVHAMVQEVGGGVRTTFVPGQGVTFYLQLPLTLSVIRALLVEISEEAYAFPLGRVDKTFMVDRATIEMVENRQFFHYDGKNIGLVAAWEVLELTEPQVMLKELPVIIVSDRSNTYGLVVDRLIGEKELVVQELIPRLGKITDISAGAIMENGEPVLIIDVEDIVRSIDLLLSGGRLTQLTYTKEREAKIIHKRILVVDDSITVREVESRLLKNQGYEVETAVNGVDGWNAVRVGHYDLVVSDVDMPRMNGIELLKAIKSDPKLKNLPVMIVSYKASEEDRLKGLEAGADYYLTKSSFHDTTLIDAVKDLIGKPNREKKK